MNAATWASTQDRRQEILTAALRCFSDLGFAAATMDDIRTASGASTGSIYHHFQSKEKLAAALFVEGLKDYQQSLLARLEGVRSGERIVRGFVSHYLDWVETHTDWARYLLAQGNAPFLETARGEIDQINTAYYQALESRLQALIEQGRIKNLKRPLFLAILVGPSRDFARGWVDGGTAKEMREARRVLPAAAWNTLRAT